MKHTHIIAGLKARLQVPLIVHDILAGSSTMDDEACYALHAAIGDLKPHDALLAIALSARTLLAYCDQSDPSSRALKDRCERAIGDYAGLCGRDDSGIPAHMKEVAAELRFLHQSLNALAHKVADKNPLACIFCDILSVQAEAQARVAEAFAEACGLHTAARFSNNVHMFRTETARPA